MIFRLFCSFLFALALVAHSKQIFLSPSGNDQTGDGSRTRPYRNLPKLLLEVNPGDTVYLLGGDYSNCELNNVNFTKSGTAQAPILIASFPGQTVRFTGKCDDWIGHLRFSGVSHIKVQGPFEFRNGGRAITVDNCRSMEFRNISIYNHSAQRAVNVNRTTDFLIEDFHAETLTNGCGLWIEGSKQGIVRRFKIKDAQWWGLMLRNDTSVVVEDGEVSGACLRNKGHTLSGAGWDPAIGATGYDLTFRRNFIHENWGEGLIAYYRKGTIEDNVFRNNWSVHLYVDYGYDLTIARNIIYSNDPAYDWKEIYGPAVGIMLAQEGSVHDDALENIRIYNNLISGCGGGITTWTAYYRDVDIMYNVIHNPVTFTLASGALPGNLIPVRNIRVTNNVLYKPTVDKYGTGYLRVIPSHLPGWTFSNNLWVDGLPTGITHQGSRSGDPGFVNPNTNGDINGFKLKSGSICIGGGIPVAEIKTDFFRAARSSTAPSVGLHEFGGIVGALERSPRATAARTPHTLHRTFYGAGIGIATSSTIYSLSGREIGKRGARSASTLTR